MPLPIYLAHRLVENHAQLRESGELKFLRPDAKSQVTVEYNADGTPHRIHTVVLSTQHDESVVVKKNGQRLLLRRRPQGDHRQADPADAARRNGPTCSRASCDDRSAGHGSPTARRRRTSRCHINPTGCFLVGGPHGDCGLTGRKIIVDTYGGRGRHGGGAFSGKDPTKVDRSAAYMARYIAKNIVAAGLAEQCEVQLSYAIGYPDPLNIWVSTNGTTATGLTDDQLVELIRKHFKLTPHGHHRDAQPAPADLPRNGPPRPLRPRTGRRSPGRRPTRPTRCGAKSACRLWPRRDIWLWRA